MLNVERRYCDHCKKHTLTIYRETNHLLHFLLTMLTAGLWIIGWIFAYAMNDDSRRCISCGLIVKEKTREEEN